MISISNKTIQELSHLAKIHIAPSETQKLKRQLTSILKYVADIGAITASPAKSRSSLVSHKNVMRDDAPVVWFTDQERLILMAPLHEKGYVKTRNVFKKTDK